MPTLDRRTFLAASAAGFAARALPALAATPYAFRHGAFDVTIVSDGHLVLPTSFLAPDAPPAERDALLKAAGQTGEQYNSPTNVTLIRTGSDLISSIWDRATASCRRPASCGTISRRPASTRRKITKVIFTHGHPDHLLGHGRRTRRSGDSERDIQRRRAEWDFWTGDNATRGLPAERAGFVTGARRNYAAIKDRVKMVKAGDEIVSGLRVIDTPGHTQGHVCDRACRR